MTITLRAGVLNSGIQQNGTEFLTVDTSNNATLSNNLAVTGNTILGDASTDTLNVGNGGLVKDASGNVGIGTASPAARLQSTVNTNNGSIGVAAILDAGTQNPSVSGGGIVMNFRTNSGGSYFGAVGGYTDGTNYVTGLWGGAAASGAPALIVNSSGNLLFNSGYGSAATAYGCRAWVNFNGTGTVAIRASGNVSSITDNGVGNYTVNFTTAMPDANYAAMGMSAGLNDTRGAAGITYQYRSDGASGTFPQTTSCAFKTWDQAESTGNAGLSDWSLISTAFFR